MHEPMRMSSTAQTARTAILSQLTRLPALLLVHTMVLKTQLKLLPKAFNSLITQCVWERKADKASLVSFMIGLTPRSWQWFLRDSTTSAIGTQWLQLSREGISREQLWPGLQPGLGPLPSTEAPSRLASSTRSQLWLHRHFCEQFGLMPVIITHPAQCKRPSWAGTVSPGLDTRKLRSNWEEVPSRPQ